jgi:hypothetical protein
VFLIPSFHPPPTPHPPLATVRPCVCAHRPLVLPLREQIKTVFIAGMERLTNRLRAVAEAKGWKVTIPKVARYVPNFKTGIHHFCIHAGGRAVIDGIEKNLQLSKEDTEPSRLALYHFGGFRRFLPPRPWMRVWACVCVS